MVQQLDTNNILQFCKQVHNPVCVTLPFLEESQLFNQMFPNGFVKKVSVSEIKEAKRLFFKRGEEVQAIPNIELHLRLVEDYWSAETPNKAWNWLHRDFQALKAMFPEFIERDISDYRKLISSIFIPAAQAIASVAQESKADAICIYGKGHWLMNAGALAASQLSLPCLVVERGVFPSSYIVDLEVPFSALGSRFRSGWEEFKKDASFSVSAINSCEGSSWDLYVKQSNEAHSKKGEAPRLDNADCVLVGQCFFDLNLATAPFSNAEQYIQHVLNTLDLDLKKKLVYRPHPLSLEEYKGKYFSSKHRELEIHYGSPDTVILSNCEVVTWNSILGLEVILKGRRKIKILDSECFYLDLNGADDTKIERFLAYLNEVSLRVED